MIEAGKYARVERERRFLVPVLPDIEPVADRRITDLYIAGTRMRLRLSVGTVAGRAEVMRKLTQKIPASATTGAVSEPGVQGLITNTYLDESEYERFAALPGRWLTKRRLSIEPMGVDVFEGALAGLVIAEAEFVDDNEMVAFVAPAWCGRDVTTDVEFSGWRLALRA